MPTGYTAGVADGKLDFPAFAKGCAMAFGALVMMRDAPSDAPLPTEPEVSTYHANALKVAEAQLVEVMAMDEEQVADRVRADFYAAMDAWEKRKAERAEQKARYNVMRDKVRAWEPPTEAHTGLKEFMLEQLRTSIDFDCSDSYDKPPVMANVHDWRPNEMRRLRDSIERHREEQAKDDARAQERHQWVMGLLASLDAP